LTVSLAIAEETGVALILSGLDLNKTANIVENKAEKKIQSGLKDKFATYCDNFISKALTTIDRKEKASLCAKTFVASTTLSKSLLNQSGINTAVSAPFAINAAMILTGTAVTVELVCAPINHPELTAQVVNASKVFASQAQSNIAKTSEKFTSVTNNVKPIVSSISVNMKGYKEKLF
jgi:hypothetical protein